MLVAESQCADRHVWRMFSKCQLRSMALNLYSSVPAPMPGALLGHGNAALGTTECAA